MHLYFTHSSVHWFRRCWAPVWRLGCRSPSCASWPAGWSPPSSRRFTAVLWGSSCYRVLIAAALWWWLSHCNDSCLIVINSCFKLLFLLDFRKKSKKYLTKPFESKLKLDAIQSIRYNAHVLLCTKTHALISNRSDVFFKYFIFSLFLFWSLRNFIVGKVVFSSVF